MAKVSSTSTFAQIDAEYRDTLFWEENDSASEAWRHAAAARLLIQEIPKNSIKGSNQVSYDPDLLRREAETAEKFARLKKNSAQKSRVTRVDFSRNRAYG